MNRSEDFSTREVSRHGDYQVATVPAVNGGGYLSWAKMGEIQGNCPIREPGAHVWINSGATREEARGKLLAELGLS